MAKTRMQFSVLRGTLLSVAGVLAACGGGGGGGAAAPAPPPPQTYSVSATVSGLSGSGLVVDVEGTNQTISTNGIVTLVTGLMNGATYAVSVATQPSSPTQNCSVANGSGSISAANVTNIAVNCQTAPNGPSSAQIAVDSAVPSSITATVQSVITSQGTSALNAVVPIDLSGSTGDTLAVAVDAQGKLVMATMVDSDAASFSADSTALALVRMWAADGVANALMKAAGINATIRAVAGYQALVQAIATDFAAGVRPMSDAAVGRAVLSVTAAVEAEFPAAAFPSAAPSRVNIKDIETPTVSALPFTIVPGIKNPKTGLSTPYLAITAQSGQVLTVESHMPLQWTMLTTIATKGAPDRPFGSEVTLPPAEKAAAGTAHLNAYNAPFNLTISQSQDDLTETWNSVIANGISTAIAPFLDKFDGCDGAAIAAGVNTFIKPTVALVNGENFHTVVSTVPQSVSQDSVISVLKSCAKAWAATNVTAAILTTITFRTLIEGAEAMDPLTIPLTGINLALYFGTIGTMSQFVGNTYPLGICAASDYSIVSCVASFQFTPPALLMAPSSVATVTYSGLNPAGQPTPVPANLVLTNPDGTTQILGGPGSLTVTAGGPEPFNVSIADPATGASATLEANVVLPNLQASATSFAVSSVDQTLTVQLVGPNGEPACGLVALAGCITLPAEITWQLVKGDAGTIELVSQTNSLSNWTIPANAAPNTITIEADYKVTQIVGDIDIDVTNGFAGTISGTLPLQLQGGLIWGAGAGKGGTNNNVSFGVVIGSDGEISPTSVPITLLGTVTQASFLPDCTTACVPFGTFYNWPLTSASLCIGDGKNDCGPVGSATLNLVYTESESDSNDALDNCNITINLSKQAGSTTAVAPVGSFCNYVGKGVNTLLMTETSVTVTP